MDQVVEDYFVLEYTPGSQRRPSVVFYKSNVTECFCVLKEEVLFFTFELKAAAERPEENNLCGGEAVCKSAPLQLRLLNLLQH